MTKILTPSEAAWNRIMAATKRIESMPEIRSPRHTRRQAIVSSGGGGQCAEVDCLVIMGSAIGGSVSLTYTIGEHTHAVSITWNDAKASVQSKYEAHPGIGPGNVQVIGGPLPTVALHVLFMGDLDGQAIALPTVSGSISGGVFRIWKASSADWRGYV